jgi:choline dehydrogenase-like flavoprotein
MDPLDFVDRDWVPNSGWPFGREVLDPHYDRVERLLGLPESPFEVDAWRPAGYELPLAKDRFEIQLRQVVAAKHQRFGAIYRDEIAACKNVHTYLHATVLRIKFSEGQNEVTGLEVGSLDGGRFQVTARRYILAVGGIENPRLLLLSQFNTHRAAGRAKVGAYFANHPEGWIGFIQPGYKLDMSFFRPRGHPDGMLLPLLVSDEATQRREHLLNCWIQPLFPSMTPQNLIRRARTSSKAPNPRFNSPLEHTDVARFIRDMDRFRPVSPGAPVPGVIALRVTAEPTPNPESRVRLGDLRDAFGQQRAVLDWRLRPEDSESVLRTIRLLSLEVGAAGAGRCRDIFPRDGFPSLHTDGSHHHMGTTRMHRDPNRGIVDSDCRVHGMRNLFITGSSVFPTFGTANPTLTILALADRLADHLQETG